jgi:hypothetical protein
MIHQMSEEAVDPCLSPKICLFSVDWYDLSDTPNPVLMKHLRLFNIVPNILVTEIDNPMLRIARRANQHMTRSKAPVASLSMIIMGVLVSLKLSTVICFRMMALRHI